jgi:ABC-type dipeptide/oligopeptide/nickel transport system ATPase component
MEELLSIAGQPPSMAAPPSGCAFHVRCELTQGRERCRTEIPLLNAADRRPSHLAACHFADEMDRHAATVAEAIGADVRAGATP